MRDCLNYVASQRNIIIYGTGKIGIMVYNILQENGLEQKIRYFVATNAKPGSLKGIPIADIYKLKKEELEDALLLLGVSDKYLPELEAVLRELKIENWIDGKDLYMGKYKKDSEMYKQLEVRKAAYLMEEEKLCGQDGEQQKPVAHVTYCFASNAGDTVLSKCVRKTIRASRYKIFDVAEKVDDAVIDEINRCAGVVLGGGGLFLPDTNANNISGWQWAISDEQIDRIKVPVIVYSVGYNFFHGQENTKRFQESITKLIEKADFVGLRNRGSVEEIKKLLPDNLRQKIVFQPCTTTLIRKIYNFEKDNYSRKVGINMAFDREESRYGESKIAILNQVAQAMKRIADMNYEIHYLVHCDTDLRFLPYLERQKVKYEVDYLVDSLPDEIIKCYKQLDCVIGMRGHAQMIPFGVGCRVISLGTHNKIRWFLEDIEAEDWYIDLNEKTEEIADEIVLTFEKVNVTEAELTDKRLAEAQERLWDITKENNAEIQNKLALETNNY